MTVDIVNAIGQESVLVIASLVTLVGVLTNMIIAIGTARRTQRVEKQTNGNLTAHVTRNAQLTAALADAGVPIPPVSEPDNHVQVNGSGTMGLPSTPEGPS